MSTVGAAGRWALAPLRCGQDIWRRRIRSLKSFDSTPQNRAMNYVRQLQLASLLRKKSFFLLGPRSTGKTTLIRAQLGAEAFVIDLLKSDNFLRHRSEGYGADLRSRRDVAPPASGGEGAPGLLRGFSGSRRGPEGWHPVCSVRPLSGTSLGRRSSERQCGLATRGPRQ